MGVHSLAFGDEIPHNRGVAKLSGKVKCCTTFSISKVDVSTGLDQDDHNAHMALPVVRFNLSLKNIWVSTWLPNAMELT